MDSSTVSLERCATAFRICARRLLTIGENRIVLLTVEVQEERERLLHAFVSTLVVAVFALLAGITFTAAIVALGWAYSPAGVLLGLTALYAGAALWLWHRMKVALRGGQGFTASLDQLRKD